ncbi:DUF4062 domain-containing protein [Dokdonia sp. R78006]|uniref:DUF4062 domain-containing protein n=1 Tax=Dokdonia sp. R78006 TaxID=3093866 RepID=UPI0036D3C7F3
MAFPKVFISSTCYDLGEVRDSLYSFIKSLYYEPVVSEKGDIFYHPDFHTHESCINEIENCDLFILIIGGRHGGSYVSDITKSIVNAEYEAAKRLEKPVFTFVKQNVYDDHRLYQRNKSKKIIDEIDFPSIEKDQHAKYIFEFINDVRLSKVNNGFFSFDYAKDIIELLGKQWSGMMYDFLNERNKLKNQLKTKTLLENISLANKKTEELIENIYKKIDEAKATEVISNLDDEIKAQRFLNNVLKFYEIENFDSKKVTKIPDTDFTDMNYVDFLVKVLGFEIEEWEHEDRLHTILWDSEMSAGYDLDIIDGKYYLNREYHKDMDIKLNEEFLSLKMLSETQLKKVIKNYH